MASKPPVFLRQLRRSIRQAKTAHNMVLLERLQQVQPAWPQPFPLLTRLLQQASSHHDLRMQGIGAWVAPLEATHLTSVPNF